MIENDTDLRHMSRACELAMSGQGAVEPNPPVGCVIALGDRILAEGYHVGFGKAHAEVMALANVPSDARDQLKHASLYVTLEPCCHHGKTPPCIDAILASGIGKVFTAILDPSKEVAGKGVEKLRGAGINVAVGLSEDRVRQQLGPYLKLVEKGLPWVIAKWAMTLDGKIATRTQDSKWISSTESRAVVHELRGRVDGIVVGIGTVLEDDPLLTARPAGQRTATRIVLDSHARTPLDSQLGQTVDRAPTLVVVGPEASNTATRNLEHAGVEIMHLTHPSPEGRFQMLLEELGRRRMTNILVEGGGTVLGNLFDAGLIDEVQVFIAPIIVGGATAPTAIAGDGVTEMSDALNLTDVSWRTVDRDIYVRGLVARSE